MSDCTNCWNNPCQCGRRQQIYPGGVIDPDDYYDFKGTERDPLKGREEEVSKIREANSSGKKKTDDEILDSMPLHLRNFHMLQANVRPSKSWVERNKATFTWTEYTQLMKKIGI